METIAKSLTSIRQNQAQRNLWRALNEARDSGLTELLHQRGVVSVRQCEESVVALENAVANYQSPVPVVTSCDRHPRWFTDRFGFWTVGSNDPEVRRLAEKMLATFGPGQFELLPNDPRQLMTSESDTMALALHNGQIGMATEIELDLDETYGVADDKGVVEIPAEVMERVVKALQLTLEPIQAAYPHSEVFLAYGAPTLEGRLTLCAFTPLSSDTESLIFASPYQDEDAIQALDSALYETNP